MVTKRTTAVLLAVALVIAACSAAADSTTSNPPSTVAHTTATQLSTTSTLVVTSTTSLPPTTTAPQTTTTTTTTTTLAPTTTAPPRPTTKPPTVKHTVEQLDFSNTPQMVAVKPGDTVIWVNNGLSAHDATSGADPTPDGAWASPVIQPGESWSRRFDTPGTYPYFCTLHPGGMPGRIVVEG